MPRGDGSLEDKAQASDRELGRRRISTILAERDMPSTAAAVAGWDTALWEADIACDDYGIVLNRILERAVAKGLKVKYAREAEALIAEVRPIRVNTQAQEAKRKLDEEDARKAAELKSKPLSPEAAEILRKLRAKERFTIPEPVKPDAIEAMSDEAVADLDAQAGDELVRASVRTAPKQEALPDVAPQQPEQHEDDLPWG